MTKDDSYMTFPGGPQVCSRSILDHFRRARERIPTDKHSCSHTSAAHGPYLPPKYPPLFFTPSYDG